MKQMARKKWFESEMFLNQNSWKAYSDHLINILRQSYWYKLGARQLKISHLETFLTFKSFHSVWF